MAWDVPKDPSLVQGYVPQKAYTKSTVHSLQNVDPYNFSGGRNREIRDAAEGARGNLLTRLLGGFFNIGQILDNIATAFFGSGPFDPNSPLGRIQSRGVLINNLQSTTQKLEGIIGYGSWVAGQNKFIGVINSATERVMEFDTQQGPIEGVELYADPKFGNRKMVRLKSRGLWEIKAQTKGRQTGYTGLDKIYLDIVVRDPHGSEFYRRAADAVAHKDDGGLANLNRVGDGEVCIKGDLFVVVPEKDYTVHVELFTDRWRWFYGGSVWSGLSVLKHSSEVEHEGTVDPGTPPVAG
ncbi:hypothetical protein [Rhodococcus erythropolis]|uniref:hypothetical protein n=1 Tax=Rhodococcus erythropolis TaxID=1833 RepID=UPI004042DB98